MSARIYSPAKTAMQSGRAGNAKCWVLQFEPSEAQLPDPLMGWQGSKDTLRQVTLKFETLDQAVAYAQKHQIEYQILAKQERVFRPKAYAENFSSTKLEFGRF